MVDADAEGTAMRSAAMKSSDARRRGTRVTLFGSDDVPHGPERFLDVYWRHARHRNGEQHHLAGALRDPRVRPRGVEEDREWASRAGHDEPPAGNGLARLG